MELTNMHPDMDATEKKIILAILADALQIGHSVTVYDGEEPVLEESRNAEKIFAAMYSTGADTLFFFNNGHQVGWVFLVYGNGADVISDCADNAFMEHLLKNAYALAEQYAEREYAYETDHHWEERRAIERDWPIAY